MATPPQKPSTNISNMTPRTSFSATARTLGSTPPSTGQGLARNPSLRGRGARKPPIRTALGNEDESESESKSATGQLIADLKEQLERAEQVSEQYRRQIDSLQLRLDEVTDQQTAAEERDFAAKTQIDKLAAEAREHIRQNREMEMLFESERNMLVQEKERAHLKEVELQSKVHRLTENLKQKSLEKATTVKLDHADPDLVTDEMSSDQDLLRTIQDRDAAIEALKLELADIHIKAAEHQHMGDGRLQALEQQLSDVRMQNARLVEENDSFQMLLSEKTLKGDFLNDPRADAGGMSSLAEELESMGEGDEVPVEKYRKVEAELKSTREEKKALTLYIDKIIGRILQHEGFEHIITGKDPEENATSPPPKRISREKPLPLAPSAMQDVPPGPDTPTMMGGFLQRARSVVARGSAPRPTRPLSVIQAPPTANENPQTAPSIPINRGHRRVRSDDMQQIPSIDGVSLAPNVARGSPSRTASGSPMHPVTSPAARAQTSYFAPPTRTDTVRAPSGPTDPSSSANSITSGDSVDRQSTDATSAQASINNRDPHRESMGPPVTAGVMKQNQLRPLRLVQNQDAEDEARKKNNRQSWMGNWFAAKSATDA